jgi:hypothetical protein
MAGMAVRSARADTRPPFIWLWLSGRDLDGRKRTNATWTRWATTIADRDTPPGKWAHRPRWQRSAVRQGAILAVLAASAGLWAARPYTIALLDLAAWLAAAALGVRWWRYIQPHQRITVRPTRDALLPAIGVIPWDIAIPENLTRVEFTLPRTYVAHDHERLALDRTVNTKVPGSEPLHPDWAYLHGPTPRAVWTRLVPPPRKVIFSDIRPAVEAAADHEVVLGLGSGGKSYKRSLATETPHVGICMPTGDGKSVTVMNIACQLLYHGWLLVILDYKMLSHAWADGPELRDRVCYAYTPAMIHETLMWLACDAYQESELTYRKKLAKANHDIEGNVIGDIGPRIAVIIEERNATTRQLKRYWRSLPGAKGPSPALDAIDELGETGRQFGLTAIHVGQSLSASAMSGSGTRDSHENVGLWVFGASTTKRTWDLLTDGHAFPPPTTHKGRYNVVYRQSVDAIQSPYEPGGKAQRDALDFALAGTPARPHRDLPFTRHVHAVSAHVTPATGVQAPPEQVFVPGPSGPAGRPEGSLTIREAIAEGMYGPVKENTVGKRAVRAGIVHVGWDGPRKLYARDDLKGLMRR